jgi:hypothetical protein
MESEDGSGARSPHGAEESLRQIAADRTRLAERMAAPRWYGPAGGALTAALLCSALLDDGWWRFLPALLGIAVGFALDGAYRRVTGVARRATAGRRTTGVQLAMIPTILVLYCVAALFAGMHLPWAVAGVAVIGFAAAWAIIRLAGRALARDLADAR